MSCTRSGGDGQYRIELPVGTWIFGASSPGFAPSRFGPGVGSNRLRLWAGETRRLDFALLEPGRVINGVVRDALGGMVADAVVGIGAHPDISEPGSFVHTDEEGKFELIGALRTLNLTAYAPGYFPGSASVAVEVDRTELVLTPETTLRGVVVWDATSEPVAGAEVFAHGSGSRTAAQPRC
jgi:hypothetical protein